MSPVQALRYSSWLILALGATFPLCFLLVSADASLLSSGFGIGTCALVVSPYLMAAGLVLLARSQGMAFGALAINLILVVVSSVLYYYVLVVESGRESGLIFLFLPFCLITGCIVSWLLLWLGWWVMSKNAQNPTR
jgi:hypothetical protein